MMKPGVAMEVFGVGEIPVLPEDAPREQCFEFVALLCALVASDRAQVPVERIAKLYLERWHGEKE